MSPPLVTCAIELFAAVEWREGSRNKRLGELLVREGLVSEAAVRMALSVQALGKQARLGDILVAMGETSHEAVSALIERQLGALTVDLSKYPIHPQALSTLTSDAAHRFKFLPLELKDGVLFGVSSDASSEESLRQLRFAGGAAKVEVCRPHNVEALKSLLNRHFPRAQELQLVLPFSSTVEHKKVLSGASDERLRSILAEGLAKGASDVHIRPLPDSSRVVFHRVDGQLRRYSVLSEDQARAMVRQLEMVCAMPAVNPHSTREGRFSIRVKQVTVDVRVSIMPGASGASVVLRLLDPRKFPESVEGLSLEPSQTHALKQLIAKPHGLFLVTGPTGSGKTTTLYTLLKEASAPGHLHIATAEDPVEFRLSGVSQFNTQDFTKTLKQLLRHDPDVMMVGELRDAESATTAVNAALTGHLVLSTIHANNSVGAVHRLLGLGVPAVLLSSSLVGVMSQRLVRVLCLACKGQGCAACHLTGYTGRKLVSEMIQPLDSFSDSLKEDASLQDIASLVRFVGGKSLDDHMLELCRAGTTDAREIGSLLSDPSMVLALPRSV